MNVDYPTDSEPTTQEYVLAVFRDSYRQQCQFDCEAEPGVCISATTSIEDWRDACDLVEWKKLGRALNGVWEINVPDSEWYIALEPANEKRLDGVVAVIARHAPRRPVVRPARLSGSVCKPAGAFLTIRSLLQRSGADAATISPSTPLAAYTRRYPNVFLGPISRLAPGALPAVRIRTPVHDAGVSSYMAGLLLVVLAWASDLTLLTVVGGILLVTGWLLTWTAARYMRPASVSFGELLTFRDLATVVSGGQPNQPLQATAFGRG